CTRMYVIRILYNYQQGTTTTTSLATIVQVRADSTVSQYLSAMGVSTYGNSLHWEEITKYSAHDQPFDYILATHSHTTTHLFSFPKDQIPEILDSGPELSHFGNQQPGPTNFH